MVDEVTITARRGELRTPYFGDFEIDYGAILDQMAAQVGASVPAGPAPVADEAFVGPIPDVEISAPRPQVQPRVPVTTVLLEGLGALLTRATPFMIPLIPQPVGDATLQPGQPTVAPQFRPPEVEPEVDPQPEPEPARTPYEVPGVQPGVTIATPRIGTATPLRDPLDDWFRDPFEFMPWPSVPGPFRGPTTAPAVPLAEPAVQPRPAVPSPFLQPFDDPSTTTRPTVRPPTTLPGTPRLPFVPTSPADPFFFTPFVPERVTPRVPTLTPLREPVVGLSPFEQPLASPLRSDPCKCDKPGKDDEEDAERACERGYYVADARGKIRFTQWGRVKKCQPSKLKLL